MRRDASIDLDLEPVTSSKALDAMAGDWGDLWARCPDATPFQAPEWLIPWWRAFGNGELCVVAFRRRNRLAGLVPLYIGAPDDGSRLRPPRIVRLLGSGNSDYLDALVEPGLEDAVATRAFRYLEQRRHRWDCCDFLELRPRSPLLRAPVPDGWKDEIMPGSSVSFLEIPPHNPDAAMPAEILGKLRYYRRYAERSGPVRFERAEETNLEEALTTLFRLHRARWTHHGEAGVLADPIVQAFHRRAGPGLLRRGLLRLHTLHVDGQAAASVYAFVHRERAYYYLTGFDPAFRKLSPGHLVMHHALRDAAREGARIFDMLRGQEAYKSRWHPVTRGNCRRRLRHGPHAHDRRRADHTEALAGRAVNTASPSPSGGRTP